MEDPRARTECGIVGSISVGVFGPPEALGLPGIGPWGSSKGQEGALLTLCRGSSWSVLLFHPRTAGSLDNKAQDRSLSKDPRTDLACTSPDLIPALLSLP